ncbi:MAG: glycosyltransferase family 2 protein [Rhodobacteraceae bacterium]|nr:glycosyltransferase family 2 protein [Paracoccaceae bacterium]
MQVDRVLKRPAVTSARALLDALADAGDLAMQARLIRSTYLFDVSYYCTTYPDVIAAGMDPAEHYLHYGAALDRKPSFYFDTGFYRRQWPELATRAINPLVHYLLVGRNEDAATFPTDGTPRDRIGHIRARLLNLGQTEPALRALKDLTGPEADAETRALAERELGLWAMRQHTLPGLETALAHFARARAAGADQAMAEKLTVVELMCLHRLGRAAEGRARYEAAALCGHATPDALLARSTLEPTVAGRLGWINQALRRGGVSPVTLREGAASPYDRLTGSAPPVTDGPKVTVLIAAYNCAATLPTSLRALQEQSWQNLEIIVIDDHSPSGETMAVALDHATRDPRIRVLRLPQNAGAYVARNHGLDHARGEYVTLHDADDWSHPRKIELQMRHLLADRWAIGTVSAQARCLDDLTFARWTGNGVLVNTNMSSFLWRRAPVVERLGHWDTVRFSADTEFMRRARNVFGEHSIHEIDAGPLSFQRDSESSIVADTVMGMNGFYFGARREYVDAQRQYHQSGGSLNYGTDPGNRPFPAPALMQPDRRRLTANRHFDLILRGDFRRKDADLRALIARLRTLKAEGRRVGLIEAPLYRHPTHDHRTAMHPLLRAEVDGEALSVLVFGDDVSCSAMEAFGLDGATVASRYEPKVRIVDAPAPTETKETRHG